MVKATLAMRSGHLLALTPQIGVGHRLGWQPPKKHEQPPHRQPPRPATGSPEITEIHPPESKIGLHRRRVIADQLAEAGDSPGSPKPSAEVSAFSRS